MTTTNTDQQAISEDQAHDAVTKIGELAIQALHDTGLTVIPTGELADLRAQVARIERLANNLNDYSANASLLARPLSDLLRAALAGPQATAVPVPYEAAVAANQDTPYVFIVRLNTEQSDGPGEGAMLGYLTSPQAAGSVGNAAVGKTLGDLRAQYGDRYEHVTGPDDAVVTGYGVDRYDHVNGLHLDWVA